MTLVRFVLLRHSSQSFALGCGGEEVKYEPRRHDRRQGQSSAVPTCRTAESRTEPLHVWGRELLPP